MKPGPARDTTALARPVFAFIIFAAALAAFIAALAWVSSNVMAPQFGYLGHRYQDPDPGWMLASYLMLLVVALFLPYRTDRLSGFVVWFLYVALIVPVATVPLYGSTRAPEDTFLFALYCAAIWVCVALATRRRTAPQILPINRTGSRIIWGVVILLTAVTYIAVQIVFGIQFNVVGLFDVYDIRLEYRDGVAPTVPGLGYLITNQGNVINPLLMAVGVVRKRWLLVLVGVVGQLILYSTTGYKTVLLSIPLCIALAFILRNRKTIPGYAILIGSTALCWGAIVVDKLWSLGAVNIFVSRTFVNAGYLLPFYREVYDTRPYALWDYAFLGPFVDAPYDRSPGLYLGAVVLNRPDVNVNASLIADGYANLGLWGIAIEAAFLILLLILGDSASRRLPLAIVVPVALIPTFSLANGSPFTALLSYGFALMFAVFMIAPRDDEIPSETREFISRPGRDSTAGRLLRDPAGVAGS